MNILLVHNAVEAGASTDEKDVLYQAKLVTSALEKSGHKVEKFPCPLDLAGLIARLEENRPDLVFNLAETLGPFASLIHAVPAVVEAMDIPYTGCPAAAQMSTSHKPTAKKIMRGAGLPTPPWFDTDRYSSQLDFCPGNYICKHAWEHASIGIKGSPVFAAETLAEAQNLLLDRADGHPAAWFAERFIPGREFNLAMLGGPEGVEVLHPAEILFLNYPEDKLKIIDYAAKWDEKSFAYKNTPRRLEFPETDAPLLDHLRRLARDCWNAFGLRGYARVDFRVDVNGQPWILEVNANPCIAPEGGFMAAAGHMGKSPRDVVDWIVADALRKPACSCQAAAAPTQTAGKTPAAAVSFRDEVLPGDPAAVRDLVQATGFFQEHEIPVAVELVEENLAKGLRESGYHFVFAEADGRLAGYANYGEIACTKGSWDLYWIAVHPDFQGQGLGRRLLREAEERIRAQGGRMVYIETSSRPLYTPTRAFYERSGYKLEIVLEDYYGDGDGKLIYSRRV